MKYWLFRVLFRKELKRFAQLKHPELRCMLQYTAPYAADFIIADLELLARRSQQLNQALDQHARLSHALHSSNRRLLVLWARAHPYLPKAARTEFVDLGHPEL